MLFDVIHHFTEPESLEHERVTVDNILLNHFIEVVVEGLRLERDESVELLEGHLVVHLELDLMLRSAGAG